jgi:hypothetical protein
VAYCFIDPRMLDSCSTSISILDLRCRIDEGYYQVRRDILRVRRRVDSHCDAAHRPFY